MDTGIFTQNGNYLMLAFDHRDSFKKLVNPLDPEQTTKEELVNIKKDIINSLKDKFSGILIDEEYGLEAYKSLKIESPYLLPIEESGYQNINGERITVVNKTVLELKNMGASGVKLLIYFNPDLESSKQQIQTAGKVLEDSHKNNLPLFLEIVTYNMENEDRVLKSLETLINNDITPDVFKIEYPGNDYLCKKVTNLLKTTPWIILTRGANYILFCEQLKISAQNGCQGFLAGRSVWQDYVTIQKPEEKTKFLSETLPLRFEEVKKIASAL